jgi:hypothetical protein
MPEGIPLTEESRRVRLCFYADPGLGKTTLSGKIAHLLGGDICLITSDSAWTVLLGHPEIAKKIQRWPFEGLSQISAIAEAHMEGIEPWCNFNTLIWDTVSTSVSNVLRSLVAAHPNTDAKDALGRTVEGWPHYRTTEGLLKDTIELLNKTKLNIIYTAHVKDPTDTDRKNSKYAIRPAMPDASYKALAREVNLVGWLHREAANQELKIQTVPTTTVTAKSQIPTVPQIIQPVNNLPQQIMEWVNAA